MSFNLETFFGQLNTYERWNVAVAIDRTNSLPLDANSIFASKDLAEQYAKGLVGANAEYTGTAEEPIYTYPGAEKIMNNAYPGQIIAVVSEKTETVEVYYIDINRNLQEVGAKVNFNKDDFVVAEDGTVSLAALPEVVSGDNSVSVVKNDDGNYEVKAAIANTSANILQIKEIDPDDDDGSGKPGLYVPAPSYGKGSKFNLTANEETVDVLVNLQSTGTSQLQGQFIDVYTKYGIDKKIADAGHIRTMVVDSVDIVNHQYLANGERYNAERNVLYLVKDEGATGDQYNEYLLVEVVVDDEGGTNTEFVLIGDTSTDLSNYYDKDAIDDKFDGIVIPTLPDFGILDITTDNIGALDIDKTDKQNPIINLVLNNDGNVKFEDTATGLKATVEIKEVEIPDITITSDTTTTKEKATNTVLVVEDYAASGHTLTETAIEVVSKDILLDETGLVNPEKVSATKYYWALNDNGELVEQTETVDLDKVLKLATALDDGDSHIIGTAGLMTPAEKWTIETTARKVESIDLGAQPNKLEKIILGDTEATISEKTVTIPVASESALGLTKTGTLANQIAYNNQGVGEVNLISTNKLVQLAGTELVLFGGSSAGLSTVIVIKQADNEYYIDFDASTMHTWNDLDGWYPRCPATFNAIITATNNGHMIMTITGQDGVDVDHFIRWNGEHVSKDDLIYAGPYQADDD